MVFQLVLDRGAAAHAFWLPSPFSINCRLWLTACSEPELLLVVTWVFGHYELRLLAIISFHTTRLETRTKESNMCASLRVIETHGHNESKGCLQLK